MSVSEAELEAVKIRATIVSVALQALMGRLAHSGVLSRGDVVAMREIGLKLANDIGTSLGDAALRSRMISETDRWWNASEAHAVAAPRGLEGAPKVPGASGAP